MKLKSLLLVAVLGIGLMSCEKEVEKKDSDSKEFVIYYYEWNKGYYNCELTSSEDNFEVTSVKDVSIYVGSPYNTTIPLNNGEDYTVSGNTVKIVSPGQIDEEPVMTATIDYDYTYTVME